MIDKIKKRDIIQAKKFIFIKIEIIIFF